MPGDEHEPRMVAAEPTMAEAIALQAVACRALGSVQYGDILDGLRADFDAGGLTAEILRDRTEKPLHDAVPLRLLGAVHRIVLRGGAPSLAARFPSAGGDGRPVDLDDVLACIDGHRAEVTEALGAQVQTNEVGRAAVLTTGFAAVARATRMPLAMLELGASAGLNMAWDRYWYDSGVSTAGDDGSPLRFTGPDVWVSPVDLSGLTPVVARRGCDMSPIDATSEAGRLRLLSFVWPDQWARFERLRAALDVAARFPPALDQGDAGEWLATRLAERPFGATTVVYHSIVWQYLPPQTKAMVRAELAGHGGRAGRDAPLAWVRMEPAGAVADLRVTLWTGGEPQEAVLATCGYHGAAIRLT